MKNQVCDERIDPCQTLIHWQVEERPIDWQQQFGRTASLEIEIGFGNGDFLVTNAEAFPERNFIGIEIKKDRVTKTLRRIAQARVNNIRLVQMDARMAFDRLFRSQSVQRVYALFPDPWPKNRHIKRRLFSLSFIRTINSRMKVGGEVLIITDHQPYFDWILKQTVTAGFVEKCELVSPCYRTEYEQKMHRRGQDEFYKLQLIKQEHIEVPLVNDATGAL
jgi:tRNA (guanine-N7-)-methyltransferase